jgi:hypothetical protein
MKKSFLSWNKDTVTDAVIFEHLFELSKGRINLVQSDEELINTNDLLRTNKKTSNKTNVQNNKTKIKTKKPFQRKNN